MNSDVIWQSPCYECAFRQFVKSQYPANRSSILVARPAYTRDEYSAMQVIFRTGYGAHHRATLCLKTTFVGRVCQRLSFFSPPEHHYMQQQPERQRTTRHGTSIGENPPRGSPCLLASLLTNVVSLCFFRKTGSGCAPSLNDLVPKAVLRHRVGQNDGR